MANVIHKGDIGVILEITIMDDGVARDISNQTALAVKLTDPSGNVSSKTGVLVSGTGGKLKYVTILDDLDETGWWLIQALVTESSSPIFHTDIGTFEVKANLS